MNSQPGLFEEAEAAEPEPMSEVQLGRHSVMVPLRQKRKEALAKFNELLKELEGQNIWITSDGGNGTHYSLFSLKLERMSANTRPLFNEKLPSTIWLRGRKGAGVRIDTHRVVALREQRYQGYTLWLLDFWNGFGGWPLDQYRPTGCSSLAIVVFHDNIPKHLEI